MSASEERRAEPCACTRKLSTASEVAQALRVPVARVYALAREQKIPSIRLGRQRRFVLAEVINLLVRSGGFSVERSLTTNQIERTINTGGAR